MTSIEIGDKIRMLDDSNGLAEGSEAAVVEDTHGYQYLGEFTADFGEGPENVWYVTYNTEGIEWEKVTDDE